MERMYGFCLLLANPILDKTSDTHGKMIEILRRSDFVTQEFILSPLQFGVPIESFLEFKNCRDQPNFVDNTTVYTDTIGVLEKDEENGCCTSTLDQYSVPSSLIERWGSAMDIVYPDSKRCCCFTKSYYRYVKGTGSLLETGQPKIKDKASSLKEQSLRYFTPREVANLHSLPESFQFPQQISLRQRYALLGNSLSISVVAPLLQYLFAESS